MGESQGKSDCPTWQTLKALTKTGKSHQQFRKKSGVVKIPRHMWLVSLSNK